MFDSTGSLLDGSMPVGPIEPATKRGLSGVEYLSHAARASRAAATFISRVLSLDAPLAQPVRRRLEGAGLDDVAADREEGLVDRLDDVGPGEHEVVVAALRAPCRRSPRRSRWWRWMFVPIAPSKTSTRSREGGEVGARGSQRRRAGDAGKRWIATSVVDQKKNARQRKRSGRRFSGMFYVAASCLKSPRTVVLVV